MLNLLCNGFLLFIPILIWNIVLSSKLPGFFKPLTWDKIPKPILFIENIFRYLSFLLPLLMIIDFKSNVYKYGVILYFIGVITYFISWILQFKFSNNRYNKSLLIRGAPAYTTIIWLAAIGLICNKTYIPALQVKFIYFIVISIFTITHTVHAYLVVNNKVVNKTVNTI